VPDPVVNFDALLTHGSPLLIRREREALSVTDNCRGPVDDDVILSPKVGSRNKELRFARRHHSSDAFTGVLVSWILPQWERMNMCRIVCSSAIKADLDQAISVPQALQIGAANCAIECRSLSMGSRIMRWP
jgi:hypothetical protein